jgi:hypothetical protein
VLGNAGGGGCLTGINAAPSIPSCNITALGGTQTSGQGYQFISGYHCPTDPNDNAATLGQNGTRFKGGNGGGRPGTVGVQWTSGGGGGGGLNGGAGGIGQASDIVGGLFPPSGSGAGGSSGCVPGNTACTQVACDPATVNQPGGVLLTPYYVTGVGQGAYGGVVADGAGGYAVVSVCLAGSTSPGNGCQCGKSPFPPVPGTASLTTTVSSFLVAVLLLLTIVVT